MKKPRRILIIVGSDSDLPQCLEGLKVLRDVEFNGSIEVCGIITASIHRNTNYIFLTIEKLVEKKAVDVIITGAGWANHLTGMIDAYLRYTLQNNTIVIFGVAFKDDKNANHTKAACLSISEVPGTQVVFDKYIGSKGFKKACIDACILPLPTITLPKTRETTSRSLSAAIQFCETKTEEKKS